MATPVDEGDFYFEIEGFGKYHYSPIFDSIHVFPDAKYNHIHYYDDEKESFVWQFLGAWALDDLHARGLPHTVRDSISEAELQQWEEWVVDCELEHLDEELDALDGDQ